MTEHIIELQPADKMDSRGLRRAVCLAGDWTSDIGTEAMVRSDGNRHRHAMTYPEHHKLEKVQPKSQTIGEFLESTPYRVCELVCLRCGGIQSQVETGHTCCADPRPEYLPLRQSTEKTLAGYFGIDLAKIDQEKRAMLAEIRRQNEASRD